MLDLIESTLRVAGKTFSDAVTFWLPLEGKCADISERTLSLHFGCALQAAGCLTYAEVQLSGRPGHVDLVAINPSAGWILVCEAKCLQKPEKARGMGDDWARLKDKDMRLPCEYDPLPKDLDSYACLLATSWEQAYYKWWEPDDRPEMPAAAGAGNPEDWRGLRDALIRADSSGRVGVLPMRHLPESSTKNPAWILYAVVPMSPGQWS